MVTELPDAPDVTAPDPFAGPDHPIRIATRQIAFEDGWSRGRAAKIAELFDSLAPDWHSSRTDTLKLSPVHDALNRGQLDTGGVWLELGAGTGAATQALKPNVETLIAMDLSSGMLSNGVDVATAKVQADSAKLPLGDDAVDVIVCMNMFLFPAEVDRVLRAAGKLLWINTLGDQTPIHLPASDVADALPGNWSGVTANAGTGFWAVYQRGA